MSLLLDALKKAAEKKAQKNAENKAVEKTDNASATGSSEEDDTGVDKTAAMTETRIEATEVDATQLDNTKIDATLVDTTSLDATEVDATHLDNTKIDATQVDTTRLDATDIDTTQVDTTKLDTTDIDATSVDTTKVDKTATDTSLKIDPDVKSAPPTEQSDAIGESTLEMDVRQLDLSKLQAESSEAEEAAEALFGDGEDKTMLFIDDEDDEQPAASEKISSPPDDDSTGDETVVLTPDDITEFLGDGVHGKPVEPAAVKPQPEKLGSDDTTITNSDSLSLTNIETDDMDLEPMSESRYSEGYSDDTSNADYSKRVTDESPTVRASDSTSTTSGIDIEKLTNDETVTIKDSTYTTRTFAPDNYDRTLLKLTDNDVSRIFPGMKSETDNVMTPDYAKKIFINKSRGVKQYYYKIYIGIALCILLVVVFWGLLQVQTESETIDNSLVALKRDPMPGIIKPKQEPNKINLFSGDAQPDSKAFKLIEQATGTDATDQQQASNVESEGETDSANVSSQQADSGAVEQTQPGPTAAPVKIATPQANKSAPKVSGQSAPAKQSALKLTSNSRTSQKDQLLSDAYSAYESGDIDNARNLYQKVLKIEPDNRDALLGRAAIFVFDDQFENAIAAYQKLLLANPKDDLAMTSLISVANVNPQTGETQIKKLLNDLPESPYLHFALGNMYGSQNRWSEAQTQYFKALQYKPDDPNYAYNLAISLEHLQKPDSAVTFYQRALQNKSKALATFNDALVMQRIEVLTQ